VKMSRNRLIVASLVALGALVVGEPARAQVTPLGASPPAPAGVLSSFAYDELNSVYLHVWEYNSDLWGRFIGPDGTILGIPFVVGPYRQTFAGKPKVAWGGGEFLVTYISDANFGNGSNIFGQLVVYTGGGSSGGGLLGGPIFVSPNSGNGGAAQVTADVTFDPVVQRFLVAYDEFFGPDREALVRLVGLDGVPIGDPVNVSMGPGAQGATALAFDWQLNRYVAVYIGENPEVSGQSGVFARLLDGTTLAPSGQLVLALGFTIEPAVTFMPEAAGFLATWTGFNPSRDMMGRYIPTDTTGSLPFPAYGIMSSPFTNEGAGVLDYDYRSRVILAGAMSDTQRIMGAVMDAAGTNPSAQFFLSTIPSGPQGGSFFPTVRRSADGIFGLTYIIDYAWAYFERFQLPLAPTPGPHCCGGPVITYTVSPTSWSAPAAGGSQLVTVTASNQSGTWTVTSGAPWLTVSPTGGTGDGTFTMTAAENSGSTSRSTTVAVGGRFISVSQPPVATGQVTPLGASTPAPAGVLSSFAYDTEHHVYLQVWEYNTDVWARFLGTDGAILGLPFVAAPLKYTFAGKPKIGYGAGRFFLTYVSDANFGFGSNIFGQLIAYTGSGASSGGLVGPPIFVSPFSTSGGNVQVTADVAYNPLTQQFLVAYDEYFGSDREAMVRHFATNGGAAGGPVNISNGPGTQGATVLAFDWARNRYLAVYIGENPEASGQSGVFARLLDGGTAAPSVQIVVTLGFTIEPAVAFMPEADGFLATWTGFNPSRDVMGRYVPTLYGGSLPNPAYALMGNPASNEGAGVLDYDYRSRLMLVGAMSDSQRIAGAVLDAFGGNPSATFNLSTVATSPNGGSFYPTVRPAEDAIFGLSYIIDYSWAYLERFQLPLAGTDGPRCCGSGPPTFSVTPASWSVGGNGGSTVVTVTAADPAWTWTVTSGASWVTANVSGGTGSGSVTLTAEPTALSRTTTVAVAGKIVSVSQAAPGDVINGTFSNGLVGWSTFAVPSDALVVNVVNGVLGFYRQPPPPGTPGQAVVFQQTGYAYPAGTPVAADFDLGNSSAVWKRIGVLLQDADFSDLHLCTFWLAPGAPMRTYRMRSHTTKPWTNATIAFYVVTEGSGGGAYRLDNVRTFSPFGEPIDRTDCHDPTTPLPNGQPDGPDLIANGDFTNGLAAWTLFGQITAQVSGGVLEFARPAGTPAGAVLQPTGVAIGANTPVTATFSLGNSSAIRRRVTIVLHAQDFTDLGACTFWLEPGVPLAGYAVRMFTTRPWANATFSIYSATVSTEQWVRLDNVTLRATPNASIVGTECIEPPAGAFAGLSLPVVGAGVLPPKDTAPSGGGTSGRDIGADRWRGAGGFVPVAGFDGATRFWRADATAAERRALVWPQPIDLRDASAAMLRFDSRLSSGPADAFVEVTRDGLVWVRVAIVPPSADWTGIAVDLSAFAGDVVFLRFVYAGGAGTAGTPAGTWYLGGVSVETRGPR